MLYRRKHILQYLSALILLFCLLPATAFAATKSGDLSMPAPSKQDIAMYDQNAKAASYSTVCNELPLVTVPYATGALNEEYLRSGLAHLNYIRFAAGLPAAKLDDIGHRRWLINPLQNMTVGFGEAKASSGSNYVVTKVFDNSNYWYEPRVDYDFVAWPAAGNFPNDLFVGSDPWSVSLNTKYYMKPDIDEVSVTITLPTYTGHGGIDLWRRICQRRPSQAYLRLQLYPA